LFKHRVPEFSARLKPKQTVSLFQVPAVELLKLATFLIHIISHCKNHWKINQSIL
jgi:hypothetical protein